MTLYMCNENGDWWEFASDSAIFIIDDENAGIKALLEIEEVEPGDDKFEKFIRQNALSVIELTDGEFKEREVHD